VSPSPSPRVPRRIHQPRETKDSTCGPNHYGSRSQVVVLNSKFFQNRNSNPKNRLKLATCFLFYSSSMVKRVRISTFDFHSRFVDRRSVHIKRWENLTCARSDSDWCVATTRHVRLTDTFTTVRLTASISPPQ